MPAARKGKGARNMVNFLEEEMKPFKSRQRPIYRGALLARRKIRTSTTMSVTEPFFTCRP